MKGWKAATFNVPWALSKATHLGGSRHDKNREQWEKDCESLLRLASFLLRLGHLTNPICVRHRRSEALQEPSRLIRLDRPDAAHPHDPPSHFLLRPSGSFRWSIKLCVPFVHCCNPVAQLSPHQYQAAACNARRVRPRIILTFPFLGLSARPRLSLG